MDKIKLKRLIELTNLVEKKTLNYSEFKEMKSLYFALKPELIHSFDTLPKECGYNNWDDFLNKLSGVSFLESHQERTNKNKMIGALTGTTQNISFKFLKELKRNK